jgi:PBSX family phage terminase large subunit
MVASVVLLPPPATVRFWPRGAARQLFGSKDGEVLIVGAAGTGKTLACLWKVHSLALKYPGMRALITRKTLASLTGSALVSFAEQVLGSVPDSFGVTTFGGSKFRPAEYHYPNGSRIVVGGMDKASKIMSAEYDVIYVNESTELDENDWESLTTRLRHGAMPYQQIIGDCNPGPPTHWLKRRADAGRLTLLTSVHEDNPALWDQAAERWTASGQRYIERLNRLTGVRYQRLRLGQWAAAEGLVYDGWDRAVHVVEPFVIPQTWPRFWAIDFGYTNPFVCLWLALDPDGRLYVYRQYERTQRLVTDHAAALLRLHGGEPKPFAVVVDHDAEDRATFERATGIPTAGARKAIGAGIEVVANRLAVQGDGKPRLMVFRDCLVEPDPALREAGKPIGLEEEIARYVWDDRPAVAQKDKLPVKMDDHAVDTLRYACVHIDGLGGPVVFWGMR